MWPWSLEPAVPPAVQRPVLADRIAGQPRLAGAFLAVRGVAGARLARGGHDPHAGRLILEDLASVRERPLERLLPALRGGLAAAADHRLHRLSPPCPSRRRSEHRRRCCPGEGSSPLRV